MSRPFVAVLAFAMVLVAGPRVRADDRRCRDALGDVRIDGNVEVPSGATCVLRGTRVKGNVKVESGGALRTRGALVRGNIEADGADWIALGVETRVGGNVQIDEVRGTPAEDEPSSVCGVTIRGNLQVVKSRGAIALGCGAGNKIQGDLQVEDSDIDGDSGSEALGISNNTVGGDLQVKANRAGSGSIEISDNRVRQNLQCSENRPAPVGAGNRVADDADGQCAGLAVEVERPALLANAICGGTLSGRANDVIVPSGWICRLHGMVVKGNVEVESDGGLRTTDTRVKGNVQSSEARWIDIGEETRIRGNLQIEKTSETPPGSEGGNRVCGTKVRGNLQLKQNRAPFFLGCPLRNKVKGDLQVQDNDIAGRFTGTALSVTYNKVFGDLQFDDNRSPFGRFEISRNRVWQNLQCTDNDPDPEGGGNRVYGSVDGQCSGLAVP